MTRKPKPVRVDPEFWTEKVSSEHEPTKQYVDMVSVSSALNAVYLDLLSKSKKLTEIGSKDENLVEISRVCLDKDISIIQEAKKWPHGCHKPESCSEHLRCMYMGCVHINRSIKQEIVDEISKRAAGRGETMI